MTRNRKFAMVVSLIGVVILTGIFLVSCKGKTDSSLSSTQQAAASSSAAMGAVTLSGTVGDATGAATGGIPSGFAPAFDGSGGAGNTDKIADIDPRLKDTVDQMMGVLRNAKATGSTAAAAAPGFKAAPAAGLATAFSFSASGTCDGGSGTYSIDYNQIASGQTGTTFTLSITLSSCQSVTDAEGKHNIMNGTLVGTHTVDSVASSETASLQVNLAGTEYMTGATGTFAMNGNFESIKTGTSATVINGTNTANASFRAHNFAQDAYFTFTIGDGSGNLATGVQDIYSESTITTSHTGNGAYTLAISSPNGAITLFVNLIGLNHTVVTNYAGLIAPVKTSTDESINGLLNIAWNPDLSQWGCRAGNYQFTTITPVHTPVLLSCPTSGELTINNADVKFGYPSGVEVTVTVGTLHETFPTCNDMGRGLCN